MPVAWLAYARSPGGPPPRRWRGLVGYGRLDIAARLILAALYPGGELLRGDEVLLFLDRGGGEGRLIVFEEGCLPGSMVYEREAATVLLEALRGRRCRLEEGASLRGAALSLRRRGYRLLGLREDAPPLEEAVETLGGLDHVAVVLGTRVDPPWSLIPLDAAARIGCRSYLASTVAAYINARRLLRGDAGRPRGDGDG